MLSEISVWTVREGCHQSILPASADDPVLPGYIAVSPVHPLPAEKEVYISFSRNLGCSAGHNGEGLPLPDRSPPLILADGSDSCFGKKNRLGIVHDAEKRLPGYKFQAGLERTNPSAGHGQFSDLLDIK